MLRWELWVVFALFSMVYIFSWAASKPENLRDVIWVVFFTAVVGVLLVINSW